MIKKFFAFPLALLLALIITRPYFQAGFPYTHDGENHLARFANYKIAVKEGQFPPRFAPNLMNHYGYPVFNYNYPLANLLSLPFSFLKINYEVTFKIIATSFILIGLMGVYHWLEKLKSSYPGMLFGTALYVTSPFIWSTVLFRGNIGEVIAWGIFPWLLYLIESLTTDYQFKFDFKQLMLPFFLLSHNIAVMFGLPILIIYAFFRYKLDQRFWSKFASILGMSLALTLWFWLPAIAEKNLVNVGDVSLINDFAKHFPSLRQLFFSPIQFGFSMPGQIDTISFAIGTSQLITLFLGMILALKTVLRKTKLFWLLMTGSILLILFQLQITLPLWKLIPVAAFIQFPWRLSLFLGIVIAGLGAKIWPRLNNSWRWLLVVVLCLQLISLAKNKPVDYFHRTNIDYDAFSQSTTTANENLPKNFTYLEIADWQPGPTMIGGEGEIRVLIWNGSERKYEVITKSPIIIVEPTMNFAGWETVISDQESKKINADYLDNEEIQGRLAYSLPEPGRYEVTSRFTQKTWPRVIGNGVSLAAGLMLLMMYLNKFISRDLNFYLNWKILLFLVSLVAPMVLFYEPSFPYASSLLENSGLAKEIYSWANFDGVHYLTIINQGYFGTGLIQAFFPLFPISVKITRQIINSPILAGLIFNLVIGFSLLKVWKKTVQLELGIADQHWPVYLLFLFPTALFFNAFYSEALFLFLVLTSFLKARQGQWLAAGITAALASATRIVGIFLIPALLFEFWEQYHSFAKKYYLEIISILIGALGLISYMIYLQYRFHDPLYFYHVQAEFGGGRAESIVLYPQVVWRYLKILWTARPFDLKYFTYLQEFMFGTLGLVGIIWSWFKVRKSYVIFSGLAFLLPTLTGTFSSLPRYYLASFSALILLIKILKDQPRERYLWLTFSTLLLIFNTILFIQGYWVA